MPILVVADVHSNLDALEAVLADAESRAPVDAIWVLGDTVGYGPQPRECIALLRSYPCLAIAGNHDLAAARIIDLTEFNPSAAQAIRWTRTEIGQAEHEWLAALPLTLSDSGFTLVHGSLTDPIWDYLVTPEVAEQHLSMQQTKYGLVGHSHLPVVFSDQGRGARLLASGDTVPLANEPFVANPGGLGQPRDGDPRTAYALLDLEQGTITCHRIAYDIDRTQAKMRAAGLPQSLIDRLQLGR